MAHKTVYFDEYCGYAISAVTENGKLNEFNFEKYDDASVVGNIYKGRIESVLPGMQAAFVDCGLERNCFLSADDTLLDRSRYDGENFEIACPELKEGEEVLVQATKAPIGKKGARVTLFPSFIGKNIIYLPRTPFVGVSRKIEDDELRKNLAYSAKKLISGDEGLVLRTAAPYTRTDTIKSELENLRNIYTEVSKNFAAAQKGDLLYTDGGLFKRALRDILSDDIQEIVVGSKRIAALIENFYELTHTHRFPVTVHDTGRDMFDELGLSKQICEVADPKVTLENGAYLVIEKCEALTVIDVNTGKFTGNDNFEQTVYYTNILAAREIARQAKLRNLSGIIVVDFIDMANPAHNEAVAEELKKTLAKDSVKSHVLPMSKFGVVEFTRQRTGTGLMSRLQIPCKHCRRGFVKAPAFTIMSMRAKLLELYATGCRNITVDVSVQVLHDITEWNSLREDLKKRIEGATVYAVPHRTYSDEQIHYRLNEDIATLPDKAVKIL